MRRITTSGTTFAVILAAAFFQSRAARADIHAEISFTNDTADSITITSGKAEGSGWYDPGPQPGYQALSNPINAVVAAGETILFGTYEHNGFLGTNGTGGDITFNKPDGTVVTLGWSVPWASFNGQNTGCGSSIGYLGQGAGSGFSVGSPVSASGGPTGQGTDDTCLYAFQATQPTGSLQSGTALFPGHSVKSSDGRFSLNMQTDGNLVMYFGTTPLWATNTSGTDASIAAMQTDGNLVLYDNAKNVLWAANWDPSFLFTSGASLSVQNDGNLVIYNPSTQAVDWTSWSCCACGWGGVTC